MINSRTAILLPVIVYSFLLIFVLAKVTNAQEVRKTTKGNSTSTYYQLPEFYRFGSWHIKDSSWKFECYDKRDSLINIDTLHNTADIRFFSVFKTYTDSAHTYTDAQGKKQFLPVESIVNRYDKVAKDKWMSINYATKKYSELKEDQHTLVNTDTVNMVDPVEGIEKTYIFNLYKITEIKY